MMPPANHRDPGRAVLVGDICTDLIIRVPEETGNARQQPEPEVHGGGTVANTAVALARLGVDTEFIGTVGNEQFGDQARRELEVEGIDIARLGVSRRWPTMLVIGLIDRTGQRTVLGWPNRNQAFSDLHEDQLAGLALSPRDWLHTSGSCLVQEPGRAAIHRALELARRHGARSSFDLNLRIGLEGGRLSAAYIDTLWEAIRKADFVLGSADEELFHLVPDEPDMRVATARLATRGKCVAIMREGTVGAHVSEYGSPVVTIPPFQVPVLDTIGAGDAFDAGFVQAGLDGRSLQEQIRRGHAVAALQIGGTGARSAPFRADVDRFLAQDPPVMSGAISTPTANRSGPC